LISFFAITRRNAKFDHSNRENNRQLAGKTIRATAHPQFRYDLMRQAIEHELIGDSRCKFGRQTS
jgi:hypothetical protein